MRVLAFFLILALVACDLQETLPEGMSETLSLMEVIQLDIPEPSGLSLDKSGGFLYCVNDPPNNRVYKLGLDGSLKTTLPFIGSDLEGITFDPRDTSLWVIEEGRGELIHLSLQGLEISRTDIDYQISSPKNGFEGVCYRPTTNDFFALIESSPVAIVHIDSNLVTQESKEFDFASDVSGICQGRNIDEYFIISHEDQRLFEWSWADGVRAEYPIDIEQAEGVVYDPDSGNLYIVCDATSQLYIFNFVQN